MQWCIIVKQHNVQVLVEAVENNNNRLPELFFPKNVDGFNLFNLADLASLQKFWGLLPRKWTNSSPKTDHVQRFSHLPTIHAYTFLRDMLEKFFHLPTIHSGDMLVGGSTITLVQDSSGTLACVFQAPGERVHPFQEKRKSVMKDRGHYITNPNKALSSGNTSNLLCIRIVWSPKKWVI